MKRIKLGRLSKLCAMVAVLAIVFGVHASSSYGQEAPTTDDTAQANSGPPTITQCGSACNATNSYEIGGFIVLAEPGGHVGASIALGNGALASEAPSGFGNAALGVQSLHYNTTGVYNTACGYAALNENTAGNYDMACGYRALFSNTTGINNMASGAYALTNNTTGGNNTALGINACLNLLTGSDVICVGSGAGPAGDISGPATYIAGIYGEPTTGSDNPLVCIDSAGLLGTLNCATNGAPSAQQEVIDYQQQQIQTLQKQNEEFQQRLVRLEALIAKN